MLRNETENFEATTISAALQNLTKEEYFTRLLGPARYRLDYLIPLTLVSALIFATGLIGNILTCIVIIKNNEMHTPTNYYLFNLTISDLILLTVGLPTEMTVHWRLYPWPYGVAGCKLISYLAEMSTYVSVLTIVAFSLERYLAICHPLRVYAVSTTKRSIRSIAGIWLIAMVAAIPNPMYTNVHYYEYPPGSRIGSRYSAICFPDVPPFPQHAISCFIFFLLPLLLIIVLYTRMGVKIRNSAKRTEVNTDVTETSAHLGSEQVKARRTVVRMLNAVGIMFFICWSPYQLQRLTWIYTDWLVYHRNLSDIIYMLSGFLYYLSTTVNPILYNAMSARYRKAFKETIYWCKAKKPDSLKLKTIDPLPPENRRS